MNGAEKTQSGLIYGPVQNRRLFSPLSQHEGFIRKRDEKMKTGIVLLKRRRIRTRQVILPLKLPTFGKPPPYFSKHGKTA